MDVPRKMVELLLGTLKATQIRLTRQGMPANAVSYWIDELDDLLKEDRKDIQESLRKTYEDMTKGHHIFGDLYNHGYGHKKGSLDMHRVCTKCGLSTTYIRGFNLELTPCQP